MNEEREIVVNAIITPDGTRLQSKHRHDFVMYSDKNGNSYGVDGGCAYLKRTYTTPDYKDVSLYTDDPIEEIRKFFYRGGYGKDTKGKYREVLLQDMSDDWVKNVIDCENEHHPGHYLTQIYKTELNYRKINNIKIEDNE